MASTSLSFHSHLSLIHTINTNMMVYHFLGHNFLGHRDLIMKMIFLGLIFLETSATAAAGEENQLVAELASREEVVNWVGYGGEKLSTVAIGGKILCHCAPPHKPSTHSYPVSGASVAVYCGASDRAKKSWAKGSTDSYGGFLIDLPSHLHAIPNLETICHVKVVRLPRTFPCPEALTGEHKAIELAYMGEGVRTYTTHNIHLMPKPSQEHMREGDKSGHM